MKSVNPENKHSHSEAVAPSLERSNGSKARGLSPPPSDIPFAQTTTEQPAQTYMEIGANQYLDPEGGGFAHNAKLTGPRDFGYRLEMEGAPGMNVSNNLDLAVPKLEGAKDIFASDGQVANSNEKLAAVGSPLRLQPTGREIRIRIVKVYTAGGMIAEPMVIMRSADLKAYTPVTGDPQAERTDSFAGLHQMASTLCDQLAYNLMNETEVGEMPEMEAVFSEYGGSGEAQVDTTRDFSTDAQSYYSSAKAMSEGRGAHEDPAEWTETDPLTNEGRKDKVAKDYGSMKISTKKASAKKSGVNEYALPDVGESYGSMGVKAGDEAKKNLDYTSNWTSLYLTFANSCVRSIREWANRKLEEANTKEKWNWHFGMVVARSGDDSVTLENYNRGDEKDKTRQQSFEKLPEAFRNSFMEYGRARESLQDVLARVGHMVPQEMAEYAREHDDALRFHSLDADLSLWYFAMYGTGGGQSFHEKWANTGDMANPMTLRVRTKDAAE